MLRTWEVQPGELVVDVTGATPAMAGALTVVTMPMSSRIVSLVPARKGQEEEGIDIAGESFIWTQVNPWDEAASVSRREGCELFNRRLFVCSGKAVPRNRSTGERRAETPLSCLWGSGRWLRSVGAISLSSSVGEVEDCHEGFRDGGPVGWTARTHVAVTGHQSQRGILGEARPRSCSCERPAGPRSAGPCRPATAWPA